MKKESIYKLLIVILVIVNGVTLYMTFDKRNHHNMRFELVDKLELQDKQKEAVLDLQKKHFRTKDQLMDKHRILNDSLFNMLKTDTVDSVLSNNLLEKLSKNHEIIEKITFQHFVDVSQYCNAEQKQKLVEIVNHAFQKNTPTPKHD